MSQHSLQHGLTLAWEHTRPACVICTGTVPFLTGSRCRNLRPVQKCSLSHPRHEPYTTAARATYASVLTVGKVSLELCPLFTWSLGCTTDLSPSWPPRISIDLHQGMHANDFQVLYRPVAQPDPSYQH